MADVSIEIKGLKEAERALVEIGGVAAEKSIRTSMLYALKPTEDQAKANTRPPFAKSGALSLSIRKLFIRPSSTGSRLLNFFKSQSHYSVYRAAVGPKVRDRRAVAVYNISNRRKRPRRGIFHGHFLEFGTAKMAKKPWLVPALVSTTSIVMTRFIGAIGRAINRAMRNRGA